MATGFETTVSADITSEIWKKLALNVVSLPTAARLRVTADRLVACPDTVALMRTLLAEAAAVARAAGVSLDEGERWATIKGVLSRAKGGRPSMLQDVEAERLTEIATINGAIVARGERLGVATPVNRTMVQLIRAAEAAY